MLGPMVNPANPAFTGRVFAWKWQDLYYLLSTEKPLPSFIVLDGYDEISLTNDTR